MDLSAMLSFYEDYRSRLNEYKEYAKIVSSYLEGRLQEAGIGVHAVFARAKDPQGVLEKAFRKEYTSPADDVTDLVGARIVTYYADQVDGVTAIVRGCLEQVDEVRSVDKRAALSGNEFGYRSVHLIGSLPTEVRDLHRGFQSEKPLVFEVQIRSLLEHAWAQIEHEVVYKSGIKYPDEFKRRFHAIAGTLEILDREFIQLRKHRNVLIDSYKATFRSLNELDVELDTARLIAFLEVKRPNGLGWRDAAATDKSFAPHSDSSCVSVLNAAGLSTPQDLLSCLNGEGLAAAIERFAANAGTTPAECSHYTVCLLSAAIIDPLVIERFPDLYGYELLEALQDEEASVQDETEEAPELEEAADEGQQD